MLHSVAWGKESLHDFIQAVLLDIAEFSANCGENCAFVHLIGHKGGICIVGVCVCALFDRVHKNSSEQERLYVYGVWLLNRHRPFRHNHDQ